MHRAKLASPAAVVTCDGLMFPPFGSAANFVADKADMDFEALISFVNHL